MLSRRLLLPSLLTPVATGLVGAGRAFAQAQAPAPTQPAAPPAEAPKGRTPAPQNVLLYIIWPNDGDRIKGGCWVRFGLRGMGVTHAGDKTPNLGHHHLLVDVTEPLNPNEPIPQDKNHLHYGLGQTEARIELPPGKHTLQLVLGDADHIPFDPVVISKVHTVIFY
jgi:hypothetical protein